jgi:hypothetical protein
LNDAATALGLPIGTDIMIGLPGATVRDVAGDLAFCMTEDIPASTTPVVVLPNAPMNEPHQRSSLQIETNDHGWVVASTSFTSSDFALMQRVARVYNWVEGRQILRVLTRFLHDEAGLRFDDLLLTIAGADLGPLGAFLTSIDGEGFPVSYDDWDSLHGLVISALRSSRALRSDVGESELSAVLAAQRALMPVPGNPASFEIEVAHDLSQWWSLRTGANARRVRDLPPATIRVDDPSGLAGRIEGGVAALLFTDALERPPVLESVFSARSPTAR